MEEIKVSVILTVYNKEDYLAECLDSICAQTLKEIEIICVDDGSTDSSREILEEYRKKDSRIRTIYQENAGPGIARNNGIANARGKYLSILDGDDFFEKDMLELAWKKAEEDKADFVVFGADLFYTETGKYEEAPWTLRKEECPPYSPFHRRQMTDNIFKVFVGWAWDKLYNREFVKKNCLAFPGLKNSEDLVFVFSGVALAERIAIVPKVLAHQRRDAKDSVSKTRENTWYCFYEALTMLREKLTVEGLFKEVEKDYINYCVHYSLWNIDTLAEPSKSMAIDKIKQEWAKDLGIDGKPESYFYEKWEYKKFREYMGGSVK